MQLDPQTFLRLVEHARTICFLDIESTGTRGDYNSVLVVSVRPYSSASITFSVVQPGNDQKVVRETKEALEQFDCWVTYYGKGFDVPMLNTRLLRWGVDPIAKRPHIDMYYTLKSNILTARKSQAHLLEFLDTPQKKMTVSAEKWNAVLANPRREIPGLVRRCESDTDGLMAMYERCKHIIRDIKL